MKEKLKKFKRETDQLLPLETEYLITRVERNNKDRYEILKVLHYNATHWPEAKEFDLSIDKRKYSGTLKWIGQQLNAIDVDKGLHWISEANQSVLSDRIDADTEQRIMKNLRHYVSNTYYFLQFYELLLDYRQYLLIRMRHINYERVNQYIEKNKFSYQRSKLVYDQMHQATFDIVGSSKTSLQEGIQWKSWLNDCFHDESLDGLNRYMALVRLSFICLKYGLLEDLEVILIEARLLFVNGKNYAKRLLQNYYENLMIMYDRKGDVAQAKYYGYLAIRRNNADTIIYINNLVNVLIKCKEYEEALDVMMGISFKINEAKNFHSVVGFVSNMILCLTRIGRTPEAIRKGRVFHQAYNKEINEFRWHRFYRSYFEALWKGGNWREIILLSKKYDLRNREKKSRRRSSMSRNIDYYLGLALEKKQI